MNERVVLDPEVHHGQPVIKGTRVPVSRILGGLAGGMTHDELVEEYGISLEDIQAALEYATNLVEHEQAFAVGS
jgi:uncharacterized protein (DUF433 family)